LDKLKSTRALIVILNWNGADHTLEALKHACIQDYSAFETLVIDNGSSDNSPARLRCAMASGTRLLELRWNLGFAGGMNVGMREAEQGGFDYVWLLNNDAYPRPDCLGILVRFMQDNARVVIAAPRLVGRDGGEEYAGGRVIWPEGGLEFLHARGLAGQPTAGTFLSGTAMLVRLSWLRKIEGFDPRFFAYWEDADLCKRILDKGGDYRAVPEATCVHLGSVTSGRESFFQHYMHVRNQWLFLRKHLRPSTRRVVFLRFLAAYMTYAANLAMYGQSDLASIYLGALQAILEKRYGRPGRLQASRWFQGVWLLRPYLVSQLLHRAAEYLDGRNGSRRRTAAAEATNN
jgi:GT2 family glycosyltransferase